MFTPVLAAAFSTGVSQLDTVLSGAIKIVAGVIVALGIYKCVMGVKAWSDANEEMDQARKSQGLNTLVSGAIMVAVSAILGVLGFSI